MNTQTNTPTTNPNPFADSGGLLGMDPVAFVHWMQSNAIRGLILVGVFCIGLFVLSVLVRTYKSARALRESKATSRELWAEADNEWKLLERHESRGIIKITKDMLSITDSRLHWRTFMLQVVIWGACLALVSIVMFQNWKAALPLFFLGASFPYQSLYNKMLKRREVFLKQFLPTMSAFTSIYQNTKNRAKTIILVKDRLPTEMQKEFNLMANKINSSVPLKDVVEEFSKRIGNKWGYAFATVMSIPDKVGGDIEEALISLTDKIAAEQISVGETRSNMAYVKGTFNVLMFLQVVSAVLSFGTFPEAYRIFSQTLIGQTAFFFIALCNLVSMIVVSFINYRK